MRILFLHGFLGEKEDWDQVISYMPMECLAVDLEKAKNYENCHLVGYSMGGRVALQLKSQFPERFGKVVALSAHPGLLTNREKQERAKTDLTWIELLKTHSMEDFLHLWYAQPLFSTLDKSKMVERRSKQNREDAIRLLEKYSLSKQEFLVPKDTMFICGTKDVKYMELYRNFLQNYRTVDGCGHAIHLENPKKCVQEILWHLSGKSMETTPISNIKNGKGLPKSPSTAPI